MTKTTTITDTAIAVDACHQLNLTGLAPALDGLCDDATRQVDLRNRHIKCHGRSALRDGDAPRETVAAPGTVDSGKPPRPRYRRCR